MEPRREEAVMKEGKRFGILLTFCIMSLFWVLLSGMFDAFHLIAGLICCSIVTFLSHDLLVKGRSEKKYMMSLNVFVRMEVSFIKGL